MYILLFFVYLVILSWLISRIRFFRSSGLGKTKLIILFLIKVSVGLMYGWVSYIYYPGSDNWIFHEEGIKEFDLLFHDPLHFFMGIFQDNAHAAAGNFFDTDSYWNNLRSTIIAKILGLFNIFSRGNYYINTLFYNFFVFFGFVALYRIFINLFPGKKNLLVAAVFLLPSALYFTSGIHRDGLIFLGVSVVAYNLFVQIREGFSFKRSILILIAMVMIFLLRNFVIVALLPALIAWWIAERAPKYSLHLFVLLYLFFAIAFFSVGFINARLDLPKFVSERQIEFIKISKEATSAININPLFPNVRSFINNAPQALNHSLMRPYLAERFNWTYAPFALEIFAYEILLFLLLLFPVRNIRVPPFIYFAVAFSLSMFLVIGYTIPIIGAIVRYRGIYFPFLITPVLCFINWKKIAGLLRVNSGEK